MSQNDMHEANRISWNAATKQHNSHKGDQAAFLRDGGHTLFPEETELLGDIKGKQLVHLQCNAGQDTLSIASHLDADVTGVDISDEAIDFAQKLSLDSGIPGKFARADVYDWFANNKAQYDVVFASYGALGWLSDLKTWAKGVAAALKPGGRFVIVEFHPLTTMLELDWTMAYDYMGGAMDEFDEGVGDYVGESGGGLTHTGETVEHTASFKNPNKVYEFAWGLADVTSSLLDAGLQLTKFREYPYSNGWKQFPDMKELPNRRMIAPEGKPVLPFMYGIVAQKPG
jgi:SAM-dependent methyltransferase